MWLNERAGTMLIGRIVIAWAVLALSGCLAIGDSRSPIPTELVRAPRSGAVPTLVVMLPGIGDDAQEMKERGLADVIHQAWPEADVLLAGATYAYYRDRRVIERLHEDVVVPAIRAGYRRIWLAGASMGGLGALLYAREHKDVLAGVVLFAPFLGDEELISEIREAGGLRYWDPGPLPAELDGKTYQRQVWKLLQDWARNPQGAPPVWLACGNDDYLVGTSRLLATALPPERFVELAGRHTWSTWRRLARALFPRIAAGQP